MSSNGESRVTASAARTDWLTQLIEKSGECMCYGPKDLSRFDYASPGFLDVFGIPRQRLYENSLAFVDLVHPDDREAVTRHLMSDDDWERSIDYRITRPDGVLRWVRCRTFPLNDESGTPVHLAAIVHDVTEQYQSTVDVLESMRDGYAAIDELWRVTYVNRVAIETIGRSRSDVIGRVIWDLAPGLKQTEFGRRLIQAGESQCDVVFETYGAFAGRWYEVAMHPHEHGISVFGRDITARKAAEEEVRRHEDRFRTIYEHAPVGFLLLDMDRIVRDVNPMLCRWLGRRPEEMLGHDVLEFVAEQDRERYLAIRSGLLADGSSHVEFPLVHADGHPVEFDWSLSKDALPGLNMGVAVEVGERRAAERAQSVLVELYDISRDLSDPAVLIGRICDLLRRHLGATFCAYGEVDETGEWFDVPEGLKSEYSIEEWPVRMSDYGEALCDALRAGMTVAIEDAGADARVGDRFEAHRKAGVAAHIMVPLVKAGRLVAVLGVQQDKPRYWRDDEVRMVQRMAESAWLAFERAKAESELRKANQELEARVEARTAELQAAVRELEGFTYSVSHDLRGPLRSIMASAMMLKEDFGDQIGTEGQDQLSRVGVAAKKMATLIDELLKISRLNRQEMRVEPLDLTALAEDVVGDIGRPAEFRIAPGLTANADARLMRLVLINLFDNATKYVARGQEPVVEYGRDERGFYVRDNGIGFEQEYAEKIFKPFERLVRDVDYPGTGVGLANVQRIIQRHGGKVWAESQPGKGATFYFAV